MSENTHDGLTFNALRRANHARIPQFRNARGELSHSEPDGSDWTPAQWLQAVVGELGEYANIRKKYERGDIEEPAFLHFAAEELADVQIYLDILAAQVGVDLGSATIEKFNEVSERVRSSVKLDPQAAGGFVQKTCRACAYSSMEPDAPTLICNHPDAGSTIFGLHIWNEPLEHCGFKKFKQHPERNADGSLPGAGRQR